MGGRQAAIESSKMWAAPAIASQLGAAWIAMDRYVASRTEERASPGPPRHVIIGGCVVADVMLFMSLVRLLIQ
jgi:hypothetical protein